MILLVNLWKQPWLPFYHLLVSSGLGLVHHPLYRLLLQGSLLWCFFFPGICLQLPLFLPQLTCLGWIHVQNPCFPWDHPSNCPQDISIWRSPPVFRIYRIPNEPTSPSSHQHQNSLLYFCALDILTQGEASIFGHTFLVTQSAQLGVRAPWLFKLFLFSPLHLTFFRSLKSSSSHFTPVRPPWSQHSCGLLQKSSNWPRFSTFKDSLGTFPAKTRGAFYDQPLLTPPSITYATHSSMYLHLLFLLPIMPSQEKAMALHSSAFAWKVPWTEEPGRLQSMGSLESDTTEAT